MGPPAPASGSVAGGALLPQLLEPHDLGHDARRVGSLGQREGHGDADRDQDDGEAGEEPDAARGAGVRRGASAGGGVVGPRHRGSLDTAGGRAGGATIAPDAVAATSSHPHRLRPAHAGGAGAAVGDRPERRGGAPDGVRPGLPRLAPLRRRRGSRRGRPRDDRVQQPRALGARRGGGGPDLDRLPRAPRRAAPAAPLVGRHPGDLGRPDPAGRDHRPVGAPSAGRGLALPAVHGRAGQRHVPRAVGPRLASGAASAHGTPAAARWPSRSPSPPGACWPPASW